MRKNLALLALSILFLALLAVALPGQESQNTKSRLSITILSDDSVRVLDTWSNLKDQDGPFQYYTGSKENPELEVTVRNGSFTINYQTTSYLFQDGDYTMFVSQSIAYEKSPLDLEITLKFPANYYFVDALPAGYVEEPDRVSWKLNDQKQLVIQAAFIKDKLSSKPENLLPETPVVENPEETPTTVETPPVTPPQGKSLDRKRLGEIVKQFDALLKLAKSKDLIDKDLLVLLEGILDQLKDLVGQGSAEPEGG